MSSQKERETLQLLARYRGDLELYAKNCLSIRTKQMEIVRFPGFNSAQRYAHRRLEEQRASTGKVRAIFLKGRQQGISTYVAARYYHRATMFNGQQVYILAHEQAASDTLFKMVDRFHTHNPIAPRTGTENVKELEFPRMDSSYSVATAGQKAGGRSKTISLFHGSEVAFWQSAADHFASSVQTVPDMPGTEILLESTGNGASGEFYERWQDAQNGVGDYIPIFIPWFWQDEYSRPAPKDFELSSEPGDNGMSESEYARLFNLSNDQMAWRRAKVAELRSVQLFDQEYPADPEMAFSSADSKKSFILPITVLRARKNNDVQAIGPLIIGADPSGPGKDRFALCARQGPKVLWFDKRQMPETPEAVQWLRQVIDEHRPDRLFIDLGHIGHAIYSSLRALGDPYRSIVRGVNFGDPSQFKRATPKLPGPRNRRAEMWDRARVWLEAEERNALPDNAEVQADLTAPRIKAQVNGDFLLESKVEMKARGVRSPDLADAFVLTFADLERILVSESRLAADQRRKSPYGKPPQVIREDQPSASGFMLGGPNSWMG